MKTDLCGLAHMARCLSNMPQRKITCWARIEMLRNSQSNKKRDQSAKFTSRFVSECRGSNLPTNSNFYLGVNNFWFCWKEAEMNSGTSRVLLSTTLFLAYNKTKYNFLLCSANSQWWAQQFPMLIPSGVQFTLTWQKNKSVTEHKLNVQNLKSPLIAADTAAEGNRQKKKSTRELHLFSCACSKAAQ